MAHERLSDSAQPHDLPRARPLTAALMLLASALHAGAVRGVDSGLGNACDPTLLHSLHEAQRRLDSLRPDKSGQTRVFAPDGSDFTTGQAKWMTAELRAAEHSCAFGDAAAAAEHLSGVQGLLRSHALK
jgi:hypothetical protein